LSGQEYVEYNRKNTARQSYHTHLPSDAGYRLILQITPVTVAVKWIPSGVDPLNVSDPVAPTNPPVEAGRCRCPSTS